MQKTLAIDACASFFCIQFFCLSSAQWFETIGRSVPIRAHPCNPWFTPHLVAAQGRAGTSRRFSTINHQPSPGADAARLAQGPFSLCLRIASWLTRQIGNAIHTCDADASNSQHDERSRDFPTNGVEYK
jgi:hypothetical protein